MNEIISCVNTICPCCCLSRNITAKNTRNIPAGLPVVSVPHNISISPGFRDQAMIPAKSGQSVFCHRIMYFANFDGPLEVSLPAGRVSVKHHPNVVPSSFSRQQTSAHIVTAQPPMMSYPSIMPTEKDTAPIQLHI